MWSLAENLTFDRRFNRIVSRTPYRLAGVARSHCLTRKPASDRFRFRDTARRDNIALISNVDILGEVASEEAGRASILGSAKEFEPYHNCRVDGCLTYARPSNAGGKSNQLHRQLVRGTRDNFGRHRYGLSQPRSSFFRPSYPKTRLAE